MDKKDSSPEIIRIKDKKIRESTRAFGERIKTFRKEAGYSQRELAEKMNVTRNTVINWEAGKYKPDADLFPGLCDILEITLNDLFGIHPEDRFTPHERSLIDQYRRISRGGQRVIDHMISDILDEQLRSEETRLDENTMMLDHIHHGLEIMVNDRDQLIRSHGSAHAGKASQVAHQNGNHA